MIQERIISHPNEIVNKAPRHQELHIPPPTVIESVDEPPVRRSQRERRVVLPNDYIVYLLESNFNIGQIFYPISFNEALAKING